MINGYEFPFIKALGGSGDTKEPIEYEYKTIYEGNVALSEYHLSESWNDDNWDGMIIYSDFTTDPARPLYSVDKIWKRNLTYALNQRYPVCCNAFGTNQYGCYYINESSLTNFISGRNQKIVRIALFKVKNYIVNYENLVSIANVQSFSMNNPLTDYDLIVGIAATGNKSEEQPFEFAVYDYDYYPIQYPIKLYNTQVGKIDFTSNSTAVIPTSYVKCVYGIKLTKELA